MNTGNTKQMSQKKQVIQNKKRTKNANSGVKKECTYNPASRICENCPKDSCELTVVVFACEKSIGQSSSEQGEKITLEGCKVEVKKKQSNETDAKGQVVFCNMEPGMYIVTCSKEGYRTVQSQVFVAKENKKVKACKNKVEFVLSPTTCCAFIEKINLTLNFYQAEENENKWVKEEEPFSFLVGIMGKKDKNGSFIVESGIRDIKVKLDEVKLDDSNKLSERLIEWKVEEVITEIKPNKEKELSKVIVAQKSCIGGEEFSFTPVRKETVIKQKPEPIHYIITAVTACNNSFPILSKVVEIKQDCKDTIRQEYLDYLTLHCSKGRCKCKKKTNEPLCIPVPDRNNIYPKEELGELKEVFNISCVCSSCIRSNGDSKSNDATLTDATLTDKKGKKGNKKKKKEEEKKGEMIIDSGMTELYRVIKEVYKNKYNGKAKLVVNSNWRCRYYNTQKIYNGIATSSNHQRGAALDLGLTGGNINGEDEESVCFRSREYIKLYRSAYDCIIGIGPTLQDLEKKKAEILVEHDGNILLYNDTLWAYDPLEGEKGDGIPDGIAGKKGRKPVSVTTQYSYSAIFRAQSHIHVGLPYDYEKDTLNNWWKRENAKSEDEKTAPEPGRSAG